MSFLRAFRFQLHFQFSLPLLYLSELYAILYSIMFSLLYYFSPLTKTLILMNCERITFNTMFISSVLCFACFLILCLGRTGLFPQWLCGNLIIEISMTVFFTIYLLLTPIYILNCIKTSWKNLRLLLLSLALIAPTALLVLWLLVYLATDTKSPVPIEQDRPATTEQEL